MFSAVFLRLTDKDNDMEHSLHVNGFSPKLVFRCSVILLNTENENSILAITSYSHIILEKKFN